jgi:hypothetical protein
VEQAELAPPLGAAAALEASEGVRVRVVVGALAVLALGAGALIARSMQGTT